MPSSSLILHEKDAIHTLVSYVATMNVASELASGMTRWHGAEINRSLRVPKASMHEGVLTILYGVEFFIKSINGDDRSMEWWTNFVKKMQN
jgi:hypothetical protein